MKLKLLGAVRENIFTLIGCALLCCVIAQATLLAAPEDRHVSARDESSSTVEYTERVTNAVTGEVTSRNHSYVAVGTGLNYKDESGQWRESQDLIELTGGGGAAALHGPHKVYFSPNLCKR